MPAATMHHAASATKMNTRGIAMSEGTVDGLRQPPRAGGVHAEREDGAPVERVVAQGEPRDAVAPDPEDHQHWNPPRRRGPEEQREALRNGTSCASSGDWGASRMRKLPARVEIATAPMLIQYGGARSDGSSTKNV